MSEIRFIMRLIGKHLSEIHSIYDVARLTHSSPEAIRKHFVRSEKMPLASFIRWKRVEEAKRLLSASKISCRRIAREIGISRLDVASRMFARLAGQTMMEFHKRMLKKWTVRICKKFIFRFAQIFLTVANRRYNLQSPVPCHRIEAELQAERAGLNPTGL